MLKIFDIRPRHVPANDDTTRIPQGVGAVQEPAILSVSSKQAGFRFPWFAAGYAGTPQASVTLDVTRVEKPGRDVFREKLLQGQTVIVARSFVGVKTLPGPTQDDEVLGDSIDQLLQFPLRLAWIIKADCKEPFDGRSFLMNILRNGGMRGNVG
jgi:hypothetical protein